MKKINPPTYEQLSRLFESHTKEQLTKTFNVSLPTITRWLKRYSLHRYEIERPLQETLSIVQEQVILGSLLGDGSIDRTKGNSYFREEHCYRQADYLLWKQSILRPFSKSSFYRRVKNHSVTYTMRTCSHPVFTKLDNEWYVNTPNGRKKRIPDIKLTPLMVAVWYLDDGRNSQSKRCARFCTNCFTFEECSYLAKQLAELFDLENCKVSKDRSNQYNIYIGSWKKSTDKSSQSSYIKFLNEMSKHLPCECLRYKVDLSKYAHPKRMGHGGKKKPPQTTY